MIFPIKVRSLEILDLLKLVSLQYEGFWSIFARSLTELMSTLSIVCSNKTTTAVIVVAGVPAGLP